MEMMSMSGATLFPIELLGIHRARNAKRAEGVIWCFQTTSYQPERSVVAIWAAHEAVQLDNTAPRTHEGVLPKIQSTYVIIDLSYQVLQLSQSFH